jgi:hypothetical protein
MITPQLVTAFGKLITTSNSCAWHCLTNIAQAQHEVFQQMIKAANPTGMFDHLINR